MASLKCSKCGTGIHYHDEPNGTEWIAFESEKWKELCSSEKRICEYEDEDTSEFYLVWKCSRCGTLHVFKGWDIHLYKAFEITDEPIDPSVAKRYIAFEDTVWDEITETDETGTAFTGKFKNVPRKYAVADAQSISAYPDDGFTKPEKQYISIKAD